MENNYTNPTSLVVHDFNIPNHTEELHKAELLIKKYQTILKNHIKRKHISNIEFEFLYDETFRVLDYVGRLSSSIFLLENEIEDFYIKKYIHSPELAKKLWLDYYDNIHHPYDLLKNRCFRILDDLDELYINVHHKNPPNWC